ncbi:Cenp-0 superfamily domain-containing protein [Histoplasma capsulatum]|uniref:Cenp-0 superfamily domain-containing protein n=1 Tax=Ajellomyces capsulatus TaxID=5037 RepID=A0A8A1MDN3_AJECA|nr:Cenp-0 superfamily domain-containing protein [Histoplasma capsulatum]
MSADVLTTTVPEIDDASSGLDDEIAALRAQIHSLTNRRQFLSSSLLSTNPVQDALRQHVPSGLEKNIEPVILSSGEHARTNHHRMTFSVTSFPFKDPSPHATSPNLLGIRFDICTRHGKFVQPYYLLLKHVDRPEKKILQVHRHTIPVFIPLNQLERKYLPVPQGTNETDSTSTKPRNTPKQDLRSLVRELRRELVAWHLRCDALRWLQEELGLLDESNQALSSQPSTREDQLPADGLGIVSVSATAVEARYIRIEWRDGRVGRIKLSNSGFVERAIIIGDEGRDKMTENLLTGGDGRIESVIERLRGAVMPG